MNTLVVFTVLLGVAFANPSHHVSVTQDTVGNYAYDISTHDGHLHQSSVHGIPILRYGFIPQLKLEIPTKVVEIPVGDSVDLLRSHTLAIKDVPLVKQEFKHEIVETPLYKSIPLTSFIHTIPSNVVVTHKI